MCLVEPADVGHRELSCGRRRVLAPFEISGAFDNVPHGKRVCSTRKREVDVHSRITIYRWLRPRTFQVKPSTQRGHYNGHQYPVTYGLR